jgi:hypothetical protein
MLSRYQTSLNCRSRRTDENIHHSYRYSCHLSGPEFMCPPENLEFFLAQATGELNSQIAYFSAKGIGTDDWQRPYIRC